MSTCYYSYNSQDQQVVEEIKEADLPQVWTRRPGELFRHQRYVTPNGDDIKSLRIGNCIPASIKNAFSVVPKTNVVGADIIIDLSKAIRAIDHDDFMVELEVDGNELKEKPLKYSVCLKINKINNPEATWEAVGNGNNFIWGKDERCGTIVISPQVHLPHKNWMYAYPKNVIKITEGQGFVIKAQKKDGYYTIESDPWEPMAIPVSYNFGNQRIEKNKDVSCKWFYNDKSKRIDVSYHVSNKEARVSFVPNNNLVWGKDELCGTLQIIPPVQVEKNPLLYTRDKNAIRIPKHYGFYIKEEKTMEKDQHYVLSFDPWEQKYIQVYFRFPNSSINRTSSIPFRCYFNDKLIEETVTFSPCESTFSPKLVIKKNIIQISEDEQIIASVECKKDSPHQPNLMGFSVASDRNDIVKCYQNVPNESYHVVLLGKVFKQVPQQSVSITLTAFASNHPSFPLSLVLSPNKTDNGNSIQLVAEEGLKLDVNLPEVVHLPIDKIDIDYSIYNDTEHTVNVIEPLGVRRIVPKQSKKCVFPIIKPNSEQEYNINVMADYMKPISHSFKLKTKEKEDLTIVSEFMPSEKLFLDTKYEKVFCGTLKLTVVKDDSFVPQAYKDTTIALQVEPSEGNCTFELENNEVTLTPEIDSFDVKVYFTSEPVVEEHVPFKYKINGHNKKSSMHLMHKDYNIFNIKFVPNSDEPIALDTKDPICVGKIRIRKEWKKDGQSKYKVLHWDVKESCYRDETVSDMTDASAYQETIELPEYFLFDNNKNSICVKEESEGDEFGVLFCAYQFYIDHKDKDERIGESMTLKYSRRWTMPDIIIPKESTKEFKFFDPSPVFKVHDGKGELCEKDDSGDYQVMLDYTEEQVNLNPGKMLCQLIVHNPSVLNPLSLGDITIQSEEIKGLWMRKSNADEVLPTDHTTIKVMMNWKDWKDAHKPESFTIDVSLLSFAEKIVVDLKEHRYNDVYCIDLGTRGIVATKMMNTKCVPVTLLDADEEKEETLETDPSLISSVTIIPKDEDKIVVSPVRQYYNKCDFVFCPTKFMVGQERMPFIDCYFQKKEKEMADDLSDEEKEKRKIELRGKTVSFDLKQPDNGEALSYHLMSLSDEADVLSPQVFIQNVYKNLFYRLPGHGANMEKLVLTYPNTYTPNRLEKLKKIVEDGFPRLKDFISFVPESDAVVAYYLDKCLNNPNEDVFKRMVEGKNCILIYDMGAGTLDLSYVVVNCNHEKVSATVERRIGIPIAGDYLDYILMSNLKMKDKHENDSQYSKKIAVGKIKTRINWDKNNNKYLIEKAKNDNRSVQDIFDEENVNGIQKVVEEYLDTVVNKVIDTILHDYDHNDKQKKLKVDRVIMSGRASLFKPLKGRIEKRFKGDGCKVSLLDENPLIMKTCVARGALLFDSMFSNNKDYSICTKNRYHKIGIVYYAHDKKGGNDVQYQTIINPIVFNWKDAIEKHGMLCAKFSEKVDNVDLSLRNKIAYIIETDLKDDDIKSLYGPVYRDDGEYKRTAMNWAFINELYAIPQNDFGKETSVEIEVTIQNKLSAIVGDEFIEKRVVENVENNYFYRVVFQPQIINN